MSEQRLVKMCHYIVNIIFGGIIIYLWLLCGFSTCYMSESEHTYFVKDNFGIRMIIAILFCAILLLISKKVIFGNNGEILEKIEKILLVLILLEGFIIILSFRTVPRADQSDVMLAAYALKNGDYTPFQKDGYISQCPNQIGLLWFWYILSFIFGDNNYLVFQFINVFAIAIMYRQLSDISEMLNLPKICRIFILLFGALYVPVLFYSTFAYGNIIAQMLALVSLKYELVFMKQPWIRYALLSAAVLMLSVAMKENSLIFAIGMILYAMIKFWGRKEAKILVLIACMIAGVITQKYFLRNLLEAKTGEQIEGMSMWSFVAMGLHENEAFCDGWYDNSTFVTYEESGYDADEQKKTAIADIQNRLAEFQNDKRQAVRFFSRKIASQWNNPTFQCFWINQTCGSDVGHANWINNILSVKYVDKTARVLDIVQFLILTGVILSLLLPKGSTEDILLKEIFIGGFLFHLVWEAKGQYALPYFMLLLPLSFNGYGSLLLYGQKCGSFRDIVDLGRNRNGLRICIFFGMLLLTVIFNSLFTNNPIQLNFDAEIYEQYLYNNTSDKIKDGYYYIKVYKEPQFILSYSVSENDTDEGIVFADNFREALRGNVRLYNVGGQVRMQFTDSKYYLDLNQNDERKGFVHAYTKNTDDTQDWFLRNDSQDWYLKKAEGEQHTYYIIKGNSALSYDEENKAVRLERRDYGDLQKWIIE